jgi:hypothetical protein
MPVMLGLGQKKPAGHGPTPPESFDPSKHTIPLLHGAGVEVFVLNVTTPVFIPGLQ